MRRLQIKFPNQIRISGWDFGSSARAMNQAGRNISTQADLRTVRKSTTERKSMSTKTSMKRIALVAVSALGLGVLTSVAASADQSTSAEVGAVAITTPSVGRVSTPLTTTVKITAASGTDSIANNDSIRLRAIFVSKPASSTTAAVGFTSSGTTANWDGHAVYAAGAASNELMPAMMTFDANGGVDDVDEGAVAVGSVGFIPDAVGDYVVRVWHDYDNDGLYDSAEDKASDTTFTVSAVATSVAVSNLTGTAGANGTYGALVKLTLTDAAGAAAGLSASESLTIVTNSTSKVYAVNGTTTGDSAGADATLTSASFIKGVAYLNLHDTTEEVATFSITSTGFTNPITASFTITYKTDDIASNSTGTAVIQGATAGAEATFGTDGIAGSSTSATIPVATKTITYFVKGTTDFADGDYGIAVVTDTDGYVTGSVAQGITGLLQDKAYKLSEASSGSTTIQGTFSVTLTGPTAASQGFSVSADAGSATLSSTVATAATLTAAVSVSPSSTTSVHLKNGSTMSYTVTVKDQFGRALPNVTISRTGGTRNPSPAQSPTGVSDASGKVVFSIADAPTATNAAQTSDTFTFTAASNGGASAAGGTITWSATGPVAGTVTLLGGNNTTTGVAATSAQWKDIDAGNGAQSTTAPITATVKDASGNLLAGVPVTFSVSGTGAAIPSTGVTVYTGSDGTAASSVYAWIAGSYTVTATAAGKSGTSTYQFRQSDKGEERSISATVEGSIVTAKVVDRFGNPVPNVKVYATKTGAGYFGNGTLKTDTTTDNDGLAQFLISGGAATVTVATYTSTDTAPLGSGQTCARAGALDCNVDAADDTAFTAYVAGTALKAEVGVGSTYSAAGVNSASVDVNATGSSDALDAANEATDAANAATDAANAAAEAADAATAAAQDAQAAVAELATKVASLIAGIKAQITTLTNLVIKIQKKVRA